MLERVSHYLSYDTLFVKMGQVDLATETKYFYWLMIQNNFGYHGYKLITQLAARCCNVNMMCFQKLQTFSFDLM